MIRIALHHALERGDDRVGAGFRRAVLRVEPPRPQVHQALGIQRGDVEILGKLLRQRAHRIRIRLFAHGLIAGRIGDVSLRQRVDQALLHVAAGGLPLLRFGKMRVGLLQSFRRRDVVDVGAERERHAPVRHRRGGVLRRGELERLERFLVVETVEQRQAFIEKLLRVGVRGLDGAVIRTEIAEQRGARRAGGAAASCASCAD